MCVFSRILQRFRVNAHSRYIGDWVSVHRVVAAPDMRTQARDSRTSLAGRPIKAVAVDVNVQFFRDVSVCHRQRWSSHMLVSYGTRRRGNHAVT